MDALDFRAFFVGYRQPVVGGDALDYQHAVAVEHLPDGLYVEALAVDFDLTRLQRACKRARQSTSGRGNHVVERGGMGRDLHR